MKSKQERLERLKEQHAAILAAVKQHQDDITQLVRNGSFVEGQIELLEQLIKEDEQG